MTTYDIQRWNVVRQAGVGGGFPRSYPILYVIPDEGLSEYLRKTSDQEIAVEIHNNRVYSGVYKARVHQASEMPRVSKKTENMIVFILETKWLGEDIENGSVELKNYKELNERERDGTDGTDRTNGTEESSRDAFHPECDWNAFIVPPMFIGAVLVLMSIVRRKM